MFPLFLSLLRLNPVSPAVQRDLRDVQELHRSIMKAFPDVLDPEVGARAHFGVLHRLETARNNGELLLYVQSRVKPEWERLPQGYLATLDGIDNPLVKPVEQAYRSIREGRVLRFRLRANPTRKIDTKSTPDGKRRNGRRVPFTAPDEQIGWLLRKAACHGFEVLQVVIAATGSTELIRSPQTRRTFQGVLFEGTLVVRDRERFYSALVEGIGPGKAYGFGLLSIGPA